MLPLALDLTGRTVLGVGGGPVSARRVAAFLGAGARVRVVAPDACEELVVVDKLAPHGVLGGLAEDVQVIDVGKTAGHHPVPQHVATLETLARVADERNVQAPAVAVIGDVVALAHRAHEVVGA